MPVRPASIGAKPIPSRAIAILRSEGNELYPVCRGESGEALLCDGNWVPLLDVTDSVPTGCMVVDKITYCVLHDILGAWLAGIEHGRVQLDREMSETLQQWRKHGADVIASTGMTDAELAS